MFDRRKAMRIPPNKPHFFKPILPGFKNGVLMPISFLKYLKGEKKLEDAVLKRGGYGKWNVKITGRILENGWAKFAEDNGVNIGDFLVLRLEGDMLFEVMLFDPTGCEKPYHPILSSVKEAKFNGPNKILKGNAAMFDCEAKTTVGVHPYFLSTLTPYSIKQSKFYIPIEFARSNGLMRSGPCEMILTDEKQRSWPVQLNNDGHHVYICGGWRDFHVSNGLKEGDALMIQLIQNGNNPIMNLTRPNKILKGNAAMFDCEAKTTVGVHPYFLSTLTPYSIKQSKFYVPIEFARSNGLMRSGPCEMILTDEKQRSWAVQLNNDGHHVYICGGWRDFHMSNGLKEGDALMIQLIQNGNNPIMNFTTEATSTLSVYPYFCSTVKPHSLKQSILHIPNEFARSNRLTGRKNCEMIMRDEMQRPWPLRLGNCKTRVYIGRGWRDFYISNGLKEGDAFMIELIENGHKLVMNFHSNCRSKLH